MGKIIGKLLFLKELTQSLIDYLGNLRFLPLGTLFISSIRPISKGKIWCPNSVHVRYKIIQIGGERKFKKTRLGASFMH